MRLYDDKELFKLRDDILAGDAVIVTKDRFNKLESQAISQPALLQAVRCLSADLTGACELLVDDVPESWVSSLTEARAAIKKAGGVI